MLCLGTQVSDPMSCQYILTNFELSQLQSDTPAQLGKCHKTFSCKDISGKDISLEVAKHPDWPPGNSKPTQRSSRCCQPRRSHEWHRYISCYLGPKLTQQMCLC